MIPAGVFNQGTSGAGMYYINFNGTAVEGLYPTIPTWEDEKEFRFTTTELSPGYDEITSAPTVNLWGSVNIVVANMPPGDPAFIQNRPTATSTERVSRLLTWFDNGEFYINLPKGTKFKIHALGYSQNMAASLQVQIRTTSPNTLLETLDTADTRSKSFTPSPYDGGTGWLSSSEHTTTNSGGISLVIDRGLSSRPVAINAIAIEIL